MLVLHLGESRLHVIHRGAAASPSADICCQRPDLAFELVFTLDQFLAAGSASSQPHVGIVGAVATSSLRATVGEGEIGVPGYFSSNRRL